MTVAAIIAASGLLPVAVFAAAADLATEEAELDQLLEQLEAIDAPPGEDEALALEDATQPDPPEEEPPPPPPAAPGPATAPPPAQQPVAPSQALAEIQAAPPAAAPEPQAPPALGAPTAVEPPAAPQTVPPVPAAKPPVDRVKPPRRPPARGDDGARKRKRPLLEGKTPGSALRPPE